MTRTVLTAPLTLYFSPTGNDTSGDGSFGNPWATRSKAWAVLQSSYDLNGQNVVIQQKGSGTVHEAMSIAGRLIGQTGVPSQVTIQGSTSGDPRDAWTYLWSPPPTGHPNTALTVTFSAVLSVTGFGFDNTYAIQNGAGQVEAGIFINVGNDADLWYGTIAFGFNGGQAWINHQAKSYGLVYGNLGVFPPMTTATATSLSTGSNLISVSGVSGPPILAGAGVIGTSFGSSTYVVNYTSSNGVVTLNQAPGATVASTVVSFSDMALAGIGIGEFSYLTNASGGYVSLKGQPRLPYGLLFADNLGAINWAGIPVFEDETRQGGVTGSGSTASKQISVSNTLGLAASFTAFSTGALLSPQTTVVSVDDGTHLTLSNFPLTSFSNQPLQIGFTPAVTHGPQLSAWMNGSINLGGTMSMLPGFAPVTSSSNLPGTIASGGQAQ